MVPVGFFCSDETVLQKIGVMAVQLCEYTQPLVLHLLTEPTADPKYSEKMNLYGTCTEFFFSSFPK
jgi:hypothetical protein